MKYKERPYHISRLLVYTTFFFFFFFFNSEKSTAKLNQVFEDVAEEMKGKATLAYINCG